MKFKTFNFADKDVDNSINKFLEKHQNELDPKGIYIDVSSRIAFVYDDETLEDALNRATYRMLKEEFLKESVKLITLVKKSWEAKRAAQSGVLKPDDVVRIHNEQSACEASIDYLKEQLSIFDAENA